MKRAELTPQLIGLLSAARNVAEDVNAQAVLLLAEALFDFTEMQRLLRPVRLVVASDKADVQTAVREDKVDLVPLLNEPETRQLQLSLALLEAIADDLLKSGDRIVAIYTLY